jgi:hypothetical protein
MFVGHFGVAFAAKRVVPRTSLALLFAAAQFADLLWPLLVAIGLEQVRIAPGDTAFTPLDFVSYPYSHSLAWLVVWGVVFALIVVRLKPDTTYASAKPDTTYASGTGATQGSGTGVVSGFSRTFAILAALVVSHWVLDWITHRPDMPLYPRSAKFGLGLWNSIPATLAIELVLFAAGVWVYAASTRARDGVGRWAFVALVAFLTLVYLGNVFGSPPPSVTALWIVAVAGGLILLAWSWWVDSHRSDKSQGFKSQVSSLS